MKRFIGCLLLTGVLSSPALALNAVDNDGRRGSKKIGDVIGHEVDYSIDATQTKVIAMHGNQPYMIYMGRQELAGTHLLYYATPDCSGEPGIEMLPDYRWDISVAPSGVSPDGGFWIMRRNKMYQITAQSVYIARADYRGETQIGCEPINLPMWITPLRPIGNLNQKFKSPYTVKP